MSTLLGGVASASLCMQQAGWPELQSAAPLQVFYSLAAGLPVIMVAFAGNVIRVRAAALLFGWSCIAMPCWRAVPRPLSQLCQLPFPAAPSLPPSALALH